MLKIIPLLALLAFAGPPTPSGTTSAKVPDLRSGAELLYKCTFMSDPRSWGAVHVEVLGPADGDDQQPFRFVVEGSVHEDAVACMADGIQAWTMP